MSPTDDRDGPPAAAEPAAGPYQSLWQAYGWLAGDMALVTTMQAIVKAQGSTYPAIQLVFLRSLVGLIAVLPLVWRHRAALSDVQMIRAHLMRVGCNSIALTLQFTAFAKLPLALVTAIGFTRPIVLLVLAALMLGEQVSGTRFALTAAGFLGILVMVRPDAIAWDWGLAAALGSVLFGTLSIIQTRRLKGENTTVMMLFYTAGFSLLTAGPAAVVWVPIPLDQLPAILAVGLLAQAGQYCWLRAYRSHEARMLAPFSYLSILFTSATGYVAFGEVPAPSMFLGAAIVVLTVNLIGPAERWLERRRG